MSKIQIKDWSTRAETCIYLSKINKSCHLSFDHIKHKCCMIEDELFSLVYEEEKGTIT